MNPQTPIYNRPKPQPAPPKPNPPKWTGGQADGGDVFLSAVAAAASPVSVHFLDGEVLPSALIKAVHRWTLLVSVEGEDVLICKHSVKKYCRAVNP